MLRAAGTRVIFPRSRQTGLAFATALLCLQAAAGTQQAQPVAESKIDALFSAWTSSTPGCAVGVGANGQIVLQKAYGMADLEHGVPNTPDTIFEAGSVSKQFTAAAILLLAREGKLSLDDPVRRYVPELPDYGAPISIRQMLQHTSGLRDWGSIEDIAGWPRTSRVYTHAHVLDIVSRQSRLNFDPGTRWSYSNTGYNLAAIIVSRVSGTPFADFTRMRIFEPLGMTHTSWRDDFTRIVKGRAIAYAESDDTYRANMPFENIHGNGGLLTTVGDLLRWNENFVEPKVGDAALVLEMQTPGRLSDSQEFDYGFGLAIGRYQGLREVRHSGTTASYRAFLARYPEPHVSIAVLCNAGNSTPRQTVHALADLYLAEWLKPESAPAPVSVSTTDLDALAGMYRNTDRGDVVNIARDGNTLRLDNETPLTAVSPRRFEDADGGVIEFNGQSGGSMGWGGGTSVKIERVTAAHPTVAELEALAGTYISADAEATLTVSVSDGVLEIARRPDSTFRLTPLYTDAFSSNDLGTVIFKRNSEGRPVEFSVVQDRVWDLRFRRQPDGMALALTACATMDAPAPAVIEIPLHPYVGKLRYLEASSPPGARLLFDTGGGLTLLSQSAANSVDCAPYARLTAFRMSGERFDVDGCGPMQLAFGSLLVEPEAAVFDLMALLPEGLPRLDGLASLQTFAGHVAVIDLANNQLKIADSVGRDDTQGLAPLTVRLSRPFAGAGLDVFVRVSGSSGPLWFEVDSANLDTVRISRRALDQLEFSPEQLQSLRQGVSTEVTLPVDGLGRVAVTAGAADIIYDGVLNADFLERVKLVLDLRHSMGWAKLH